MPPTENPTAEAPAFAAAASDVDAPGASRVEGTRQTLNLRPRDAEKLDKLKTFIDGNANEALRMALTIADVVRETTVNGGQITVINSDGEQQVLRLII